MPALDALLEKNIRFIDYEKIMDKKGKRLVAFGKFAGIAGTIDLLSFVGKFLLTKGFSTPFLNICNYFLFTFN
jgi:alpha-aminoadipic semialdehyde synthase